MPLMIIAILTTAIVTWLTATRWKRPEELVEPRPSIPVLGIQIICGDCAGDQRRPIKTFLDRFGSCARCGGRSYVLASASGWFHAGLTSSHQQQGRVLSFNPPIAQPERSKNIA